MDVPLFKSLVENNPTLELLRAQHAALILDFLWHTYRDSGEVVGGFGLAKWFRNRTPQRQQEVFASL